MYFIDMELCELDLHEYAQRDKCAPTLPDWRIAREEDRLLPIIRGILTQILSGLVYIHGRNEVHRDLNQLTGIALHAVAKVSNWQSYIHRLNGAGKSPILG
jgi:serine/threonine protein kinase